MSVIELRGVEVHNLKKIDLDLPLGELIVVSGVSGAGKSSLAIDTLHAEGRRRYIETLSAGARQSLERVERPTAARIDRIGASAAVVGDDARSRRGETLAKLSELELDLAIVYSKLGEIRCPQCGLEVGARNPAQVAAWISTLPEKTRYQIAFPVALETGQPAGRLVEALRKRGYVRFRRDGEFHELSMQAVEGGSNSEIEVVVDRLVRGTESHARALESIETSFQEGRGRCRIILDNETWSFQTEPRCPRCGTLYRAPEPALFCEREGSEAGFGPDALAVRLDGLNFQEALDLAVSEARVVFARAIKRRLEHPLASRYFGTILTKLELLERLGMGSLSLGAGVSKLSDGQIRRAKFPAFAASGLVNVMCVFEDPAEGLHPEEIESAVGALKWFRDKGNTVVAISNNHHVIRSSDFVVDLGPGAGESGGHVVYQGPPAGLEDCEASTTARFLDFDYRAWNAKRTPRNSTSEAVFVSIEDAKHTETRIPLGLFCLVVGPGGSGKTDLVAHALPSTLTMLRERRSGGQTKSLGTSVSVVNAEPPESILVVNSSSSKGGKRTLIARSIGAFDEIRSLFASTREAKIRGLTPGFFSFSVGGGRCSSCRGLGVIPFDMHFLADLTTPCPACSGKRYRPEALEIHYHDKSVADVLDLTVREAFAFFRNRRKIQARMRGLLDLGLDYLRLGQPIGSLSTGEKKRIALARIFSERAIELKRNQPGQAPLLILEEPAAGLHHADVLKLIDALDSWVDGGGSLIVVDHHPLLFCAADWVLDFGSSQSSSPQVLHSGPPRDYVGLDTPTGRSLGGLLRKKS